MKLLHDSKHKSLYLVGGRDSEYAIEFMDDVAKRLAHRVQITTDGHHAYVEAVEGAFGGDVDFAQLIKIYDSAPDSKKGRCSPFVCTTNLTSRGLDFKLRHYQNLSGFSSIRLRLKLGFEA